MKTLIAAGSVLALTLCAAASTSCAYADTPDDISRGSDEALQRLIDTNPAAAAISEHARGTLVFPKIVKAGLVVGGAYGEG
jgi:lipid-binding SYLF domain-containing protein